MNQPQITATELETPARASDKEKHDFLVTILKESRYGLIDFMFKHGTVLTLALGWLLTSDKSREFIGSSRSIQIVTACLIFVYAGLFSVWIYAFRVRSASSFQYLVEMNYMPADFYTPLCVTKRVVIGFMAIHYAVCVVAIVFVFLAK
jgi:Ni/Fe-hydrogenase subunit HybB-like protein